MIILNSLIDASRSDHLSAIEDQQDRLKRLLWLTRNITRPPSPATYETLYNFQELFEFEAGLRKIPLTEHHDWRFTKNEAEKTKEKNTFDSI